MNLTNSPKPANESRLKEVKLVLEQNEIFHIVFDLPTPRPHFIILFNKDYQQLNKQKSSLKYLNKVEINALLDLIEKFRIKTNNNLGDLILSFHTGYWASTKYFHAHLCVDRDRYLDYIEETNFDTIRFNPTKKWQIKRNNISLKDLYIENVKNYEKVSQLESDNYRENEINIIKTRSLKMKSINSTYSKNEKFEIYYDLKRPYLIFVLNDLPHLTIKQKYTELLNIMTDFASDYDLFSPSNGCHICLTINENEQITGHIRMSGDYFFSIHPIGESFVQNFAINSNYRVES